MIWDFHFLQINNFYFCNKKLSVLYDSVLSNLDSIIDLHSDLIFKNYLMLELINACHKQPELLDFKNLVKVNWAIFFCIESLWAVSDGLICS